MTIVIDSDVSAPVLLNRIASSLNHGPLALITGVIVTPPFPLAAFTVRLTVVVRVRVPFTPVTVIVAAPVVAVAEAVNVNMLLVPAADAGLNAAVPPAGSPV